MSPEQSLLALVDNLQSHIGWLKETGHTGMPVIATEVPPVSPDSGTKEKALLEIAYRMETTAVCPLQRTATRIVPGQGNPNADLMFIGEGPGADEDRVGMAFVGRAGQLLTKIVEAMGMTREEVWIGNIVKWRPPKNRTPLPEEIEACMPYLREQIAVIDPRVIVCLGTTATKGLLDAQAGITRLRGTWLSFDGIDVMPTYHPAYLLRNPLGKRQVWEDMQSVLARLGRDVPPRKN